MDIYRDIFGYVIRVDNDEAVDLQKACETPEYHSPLLTQIANDIARLETEPSPFEDEPEPEPEKPFFKQLAKIDALLAETDAPLPETVVPDSEDSAHVEVEQPVKRGRGRPKKAS